jgi:hypothetical protein
MWSRGAEQQAACGSLERQHARDERGDGDDQEQLGPDRAQRVLEDRWDRIGILPVHDRLKVRRSQHVTRIGEQTGNPTDEDREHHGFGDPAGRIVDLFGHAPACLEPVE